MQEVTFTLQTITPLFLAGSDQTTAELRTPSFRGLMRYWQRALVGGLVGATSQKLEEVKKAETEVFGSTNVGSAVSIKVSATSNAIKEFTEPISVRVGGKWQATGKGYLLWSMARSGRADKNNLKPARWYFPPGTQFDVTLSTRDEDIKHLEQALAAFWLLVQLGGVGSRSRRCAGSLAVQAMKGEFDASELPFLAAENAQALKLQLEYGIRTARSFYKEIKPDTVREAGFDILARDFCRIWILQDEQPWRSSEEAMQRIGEKLQGYRSQVSIGQRKIFGLPLPPIVFNKRRASPLLLRVAKLQGNKYVGVAILFQTTNSDARMAD